MKKANYPKSVTDVVDDKRTYKPAVLKAMKRYRDRKPWRGTLIERVEKLRKLHCSLCKAYSITPGLLIDVPEPEQTRGNGVFISQGNRCEIILTGKLSVLTYLHEFAHAAFGADEFKACAWSVNLYKRIFPVAWRKMKHDGHMIVKPETENQQPKGTK